MKKSEILRILMPERTKADCPRMVNFAAPAGAIGETDLDGTWTISDVEFYNDIYDSQSMDPTPTEKQIKIRVNHSISKNVQQICTDLHKRRIHIENIFKRTDQDGSRELNLQETNS